MVSNTVKIVGSTVVGGGIISPIVAANWQEWAKANGSDQFLVRHLGPAMDEMARITLSNPFLFTAVLLAGIGLAIGIRWVLDQWSVYWPRLSWVLVKSPAARKLSAMTLVLVFGGGLILTLLWLAIESRQPQNEIATTQKTTAVNSQDATPSHKEDSAYLRLQFGSNNAIPIATGLTNIWRWYALANIVGIISQNGERKEIKTWNIFLSLEKPVDIKQVIVDSSVILPRYEVKDKDTRSVIIAFAGDLVDLSLEIKILSTAAWLATPR